LDSILDEVPESHVGLLTDFFEVVVESSNKSIQKILLAKELSDCLHKWEWLVGAPICNNFFVLENLEAVCHQT
jgi:hypothetical protein